MIKRNVPGKKVFKTKRIENGVAEKYKPIFVANGFVKFGGVYFGETFAPINRPETFRLVLALASQHKLYKEHLDVK